MGGKGGVQGNGDCKVGLVVVLIIGRQWVLKIPLCVEESEECRCQCQEVQLEQKVMGGMGGGNW